MYGAVKNFHTLWLQTLEICFTTVEGRSWRLMCARAVFPVKVEGQSPSLTLSTSLCSLEIHGIPQFVSSFLDPPCNPSDHFLCSVLCHPAFLEGDCHQV